MDRLLNVLEEAQRVTSAFGLHSSFDGMSFTQPYIPNSLPESSTTIQPEKLKNWKKPKDMPRRPLSAYNLFFQSERKRIVSSITKDKDRTKDGKPLGVGFAGLAREIAAKWKTLASSEKLVFEEHAKKEKLRYKKEIDVWRSKQAKKKKEEENLKAEKAEVMAKNSKPSSPISTMYEVEDSVFDASDITGQSLHLLMRQSLCEKQPSQTSCFGLPQNCYSGNFMSLATALNMKPDAQIPFTFPPEVVNSADFVPSSIFDPIGEDDCKPTANIYWKSLAKDIFCESKPITGSKAWTESSFDDLTDFMQSMEGESSILD
jgi:hypothetical protein